MLNAGSGRASGRGGDRCGRGLCHSGSPHHADHPSQQTSLLPHHRHRPRLGPLLRYPTPIFQNPPFPPGQDTPNPYPASDMQSWPQVEDLEPARWQSFDYITDGPQLTEFLDRVGYRCPPLLVPPLNGQCSHLDGPWYPSPPSSFDWPSRPGMNLRAP
jgi:hypothetical protein